MSGEKKPTSAVWNATKPFLNGGLSGMGATCIIQPIDMVKVRLQIGTETNPVRSPLSLETFLTWISCENGLAGYCRIVSHFCNCSAANVQGTKRGSCTLNGPAACSACATSHKSANS